MNWKIRTLLLLLCAACAKDKFDITKPPTSATQAKVGEAYEAALKEMKAQNYLEATSIFEHIKNTYPYSQYAPLSELALADMQYERDEFLAAANAYGEFVKAHPSHPKADYAAYRVGLSHYQEKPSDFFLLPPSYERDQTPLKLALDAWNKFVVSYPKSELTTKARDLMNDCRQRLAAHDRYVAEFYGNHEAWRGAAGRWLAIADGYGDLDEGRVRGESLWRAALAWRNAQDPADERNALQRLLQESPRDPHRAEAETMLKQIPADAPVKPPEPTRIETEKTPVGPASRGQHPEQETPSQAPPGK